MRAIRGRLSRCRGFSIYRRALAFALAALAACGGDEAASDAALPSYCVEGTPSVEVGTGASSFVPIEEGGAVPIVSGPQGGTHIWISARTRGLGPSALVEYGADDAATGELLTWNGLRQVVPLRDAGDGGEVHGLTGFLSNPDPAANAGRKVFVWIRVIDDCDKASDDGVEATLVVPPPSY